MYKKHTLLIHDNKLTQHQFIYVLTSNQISTTLLKNISCFLFCININLLLK